MSCEDQALTATKHCVRCRIGFNVITGEPVYPLLELKGEFWCCPKCGGSYGRNPHPNCPPVNIDIGDGDSTILSVVRRSGIEFVRELKPGETWMVFGNALIIAHPERKPEFIPL